MNSMHGATGYRGSSGGNIQGRSAGGFSGDKIPKGYKTYQMQNFDPQQMQTYQNQFQHVAPDSYLGKLAAGDQSLFEEIEAPAHRQFQEKIGGVSNRFSNAGMGSRRSSGFQNATNQASSDFAMNLQAQRMGMRNQALQELMGYSNQLLGQKPYDRFIQEKPQKEGIDWWGLGGSALGAAGGFFAGGPVGAVQGASLGYNLGSSLGGRGGGSGGMSQSLQGFTPTSFGNSPMKGGGISTQGNFDPSMFY